MLQFYPSKFVLVTEILEAFSTLVFQRIKTKSTIYDDGIAIPLKGTILNIIILHRKYQEK